MARLRMFLRGRLRAAGLIRDRRGATAIEFAILALPFILLIFAVFETTISFTAEQVMSNATDKVARQVRTGQISLETTDADAFRKMICDDLEVFVADDCPDLHFDLQAYDSFADVPKSIPFSSPGVVDTSSFTYAPGGPEQINNLRVLYKWPVLTDIMKSRLAGLKDGRILLYSTTTWQNEPF